MMDGDQFVCGRKLSLWSYEVALAKVNSGGIGSLGVVVSTAGLDLRLERRVT